jgi:regulator of nucleoside diphosphate kinase
MNRNHEIRLTELDAARLGRVVTNTLKSAGRELQGANELESVLDAAAVVPSSVIDPDVVTMNSTVVLERRPAGERSRVTLVYPQDVDPERGRVSVLSPVGRALLGARTGDVLRVPVPGHGEREFSIVELSWQPEANGRFDL